MMPANRRFLGDLDAEGDEHFSNHFVESLDLDRILTKKSDIIYGSKGVGKTALRRALTEINEPYYFATKTIDLAQISFLQVHDALTKLKDTAKTEVVTLARNTWRNILAMYCLEAVLPKVSSGLRKQLEETLDREGFRSPDSNNRLISYIERLLVLIADAASDNPSEKTPLGLNETQRSLLTAFPSNPLIADRLRNCHATIRQSDKSVVVCIDGFDSIVDHTPESRRAIFAGLIDAIHKCSKDELFAGVFCFKAFLPQELADDALDLVWDQDKLFDRTHYLRWSESHFQSLVHKRLIAYSKRKSRDFQDIWLEHMPPKVRNSSHQLEENSFSYILSHTLYRPRQVLAHLQAIFNNWDSLSGSPRVDPTFIPGVVANTNYELSRSVISQIEVKHPGITAFFQSWNGAPNTMMVGDFQDRLRRIMGYTIPDSHTVFNDLFNFGVIGLTPIRSATERAPQNYFRFGFVGDRMSRNVHTTVDATDLLALSPMLHEYCGCAPSEFGAVIPVDKVPQHNFPHSYKS
jgi:hypothetical protein